MIGSDPAMTFSFRGARLGNACTEVHKRGGGERDPEQPRRQEQVPNM